MPRVARAETDRMAKTGAPAKLVGPDKLGQQAVTGAEAEMVETASGVLDQGVVRK